MRGSGSHFLKGDLNRAALAEEDWDLVADPLVGVDALDGEEGNPFRWVLTLLSCISINGHRESTSAIMSIYKYALQNY